MLQAFVITLREGLEAFLIVAISLAYLKKTGRSDLARAVHWGIAVSVVISVAGGVLLERAANQSLYEGVLALVAAVLVASLTAHMWRVAKRMKREIEGRLERATMQGGRGGVPGGLPLHAADDHARGHGDGAADERAACSRCGR